MGPVWKPLGKGTWVQAGSPRFHRMSRNALTASCLSLPLPHGHNCGWAMGTPPTQRVTKALTSHLNHVKVFPSPHGRQVPHHYIQGLDGLKRDTRQPARESIMQSLQTHTGHPLYSHLKYSVLPFSWQRDLQLHLQQYQTTNQDDSFHWKGGKQKGLARDDGFFWTAPQSRGGDKKQWWSNSTH